MRPKPARAPPSDRRERSDVSHVPTKTCVLMFVRIARAAASPSQPRAQDRHVRVRACQGASRARFGGRPRAVDADLEDHWCGGCRSYLMSHGAAATTSKDSLAGGCCSVDSWHGLVGEWCPFASARPRLIEADMETPRERATRQPLSHPTTCFTFAARCLARARCSRRARSRRRRPRRTRCAPSRSASRSRARSSSCAPTSVRAAATLLNLAEPRHRV